MVVRALLVPARHSRIGIGYDLRKIPGLVCWLDAKHLARSVAGDATVQTWPDLSGNGNDATQGTATNRPTLKLRIKNDKPAVRFDGADNWMNVPVGTAGLDAPGVTAVMVARLRPTASSTYVLGSSGTSGQFFFVRGTTSATVFGAGAVTSSNATVGGWHTYTLRHDGAQPTAFIDGVAATAFAADASAADVNLNLGSLNDGASNFANCDVAALALFNRALTDGERIYVQTMLANAWMRPYLADEIELDSPLSWFRLEDAVQNGVATDSGSLANHGLYSGSVNRTPGIVAFREGKACRFNQDATIPRMEAAHAAGYVASPLTLEIVARCDSLPSVFGQVAPGIIKVHSGAIPAAFSFSQAFGAPTPDAWFLTLFQSPAGTKVTVTAAAAMVPGQIIHAIGTITNVGGTNGTGLIELFINGTTQGTASLGAGQVINPADDDLVIGGLGAERTDGVRQHAALYAGVMSGTRITAHSNAAKNGT